MGQAHLVFLYNEGIWIRMLALTQLCLLHVLCSLSSGVYIKTKLCKSLHLRRISQYILR